MSYIICAQNWNNEHDFHDFEEVDFAYGYETQ